MADRGEKKGILNKIGKAGRSKEHSDLKNCQDNGWLYADSDIREGVNYKVKYLGSVEVDLKSDSAEKNQELASTAMRALYNHNKQDLGSTKALPTMALRISTKTISLHNADASKIVMRHSTTRIAYSTVDAERPKTFAYVAVVKGTDLALCHVFSCKSKKQGYEMTFVCAQAFDMNFRDWTANKEKAMKEAHASESQDVEPANAWQKKGGVKSSAGGSEVTAPTAAAESNTPSDATAATAPASDAPSKSLSPSRGSKVFLAIQSGQDPADLAAQYFASIGLSAGMVEDDEDDNAAVDAAFSNLARARSEPNMLELGVDTDEWNALDDGSEDGGEDVGYMTVGSSVAFDPDEGF